MASYCHCAAIAARSSNGLLSASGALRHSARARPLLSYVQFPSNPRTKHFRVFSSMDSGDRSSSPSSSSPSSSPPTSSSSSLYAPTNPAPHWLPPELRPRMPAVPESRPKPTTAVAVVEDYLDKLWRDFFTKPYNWYDNRLKKRAPKYADFKNKLTKEGLWITARWNPPWVRTELSLMTDFKPVPYDDPLWEEKRKAEEEESRPKPPPVAPGAWLKDELLKKRAAKTEGSTESTQPTIGDVQVTQPTPEATKEN